MKKKIADKWIEALHSGEYEQTTGKLHTNEGFCCLGVLCDLAVKEGVIPKPELLVNSVCGIRQYEGQMSGLPKKVMEWAGIGGSLGDFVKAKDQSNTMPLYYLNDAKDYTFPEIADVIQLTYKEL